MAFVAAVKFVAAFALDSDDIQSRLVMQTSGVRVYNLTMNRNDHNFFMNESVRVS